MATKGVSKATPFAKNKRFARHGDSHGYIFSQELLAQAKVDSAAEFDVQVGDHIVIFRFAKNGLATKRTRVRRPLSRYFDRITAGTFIPDEIFPSDETRGKERL